MKRNRGVKPHTCAADCVTLSAQWAFLDDPRPAAKASPRRYRCQETWQGEVEAALFEDLRVDVLTDRAGLRHPTPGERVLWPKYDSWRRPGLTMRGPALLPDS